MPHPDKDVRRALEVGVLVLLVGLLEACVGHHARWARQRIYFSAWCNMTLIQDVRTGTCFVAYHCGVRSSPALVLAPREVCEP